MIANMPKLDRSVAIADPPLTRALFSWTSLAWVWLPVRLYLGYQWLRSSLDKLGDPNWMDDGSALLSYWERAVAIPAAPAKPPITYDWYRGFLHAMIDAGAQTWFARVIAFGEIAVGVGLIVGAFVGLAAFFGAFMNVNYMLAGSASSNPVLLVLAILLILAWRTAGHLGADRVLLPLLHPWKHRQPASAVDRLGPRHLRRGESADRPRDIAA